MCGYFRLIIIAPDQVPFNIHTASVMTLVAKLRRTRGGGTKGMLGTDDHLIGRARKIEN